MKALWCLFCVFAAKFALITFLPTVHACHANSTAVGVCLHIYLERDFPSLEGIIYPKRPNDPGSTANNKQIIFLGGEELNNTYNRIGEVVKCLEDIQSSCHYYVEFFPYRHLVTSIRRTHTWLGEDLQKRFGTLLRSLNCYEEARRRTRPNDNCYESQVPMNVWQKIMRVEIGMNICRALERQLVCLEQSGIIEKQCTRPEAPILYRNATSKFLHEWCNGTTRNFPLPLHYMIFAFVLVFLGRQTY